MMTERGLEGRDEDGDKMTVQGGSAKVCGTPEVSGDMDHAARIVDDRSGLILSYPSAPPCPAIVSVRRVGSDEYVIRRDLVFILLALQRARPFHIDGSSEIPSDIDIPLRVDGNSSHRSFLYAAEGVAPDEFRPTGAFPAWTSRTTSVSAGAAVLSVAGDLGLAAVRKVAITGGEPGRTLGVSAYSPDAERDGVGRSRAGALTSSTMLE